MTTEGLSSFFAKLESASSKNNEILEINVLQKLTSHALCGVTSGTSGWIEFVNILQLTKYLPESIKTFYQAGVN